MTWPLILNAFELNILDGKPEKIGRLSGNLFKNEYKF